MPANTSPTLKSLRDNVARSLTPEYRSPYGKAQSRDEAPSSGGELGMAMERRARAGLWAGAIRSGKQADGIIRLAGWPGIAIGLLILVSCIQNLGADEPSYDPSLFYGRIGLAIALLAPSSMLLLFRSKLAATLLFLAYALLAITWMIIELYGFYTGHESAAAAPVFVVLSVVLLCLSYLGGRAMRAVRSLSQLKTSDAFD